MRNGTAKHLWLSALSGVAWGGIAWLLGAAHFPRLLPGGLLASPAIGLCIGAVSLYWRRLSRPLRALAALGTLYLAAALFGAALGVYDWLGFDLPGRDPGAVVVQAIVAVLWGVTFTGFFVFLWPMAYANHWLLTRSVALSPQSSPR